MPYRDEQQAQQQRIEALTAERDAAEAALERARAGLASVVADMAGLPAEADIPWRSLHGGEPMDVTFVNETPAKVSLVRLSYDGRAREEVTVVPGGAQTVSTFVAHLWRASDPSGAVVAQAYVRANQPRMAIRAGRGFSPDPAPEAPP